MTEKETAELFRQRGFRATPQRIAVYRYLCDHPTHPDAEAVYSAVLSTSPTFSRTTVYNALTALEKNGFITSIHIDPERVHYDACTSLHGHFRCTKCGKIFDFEVKSIIDTCPEEFVTQQREVYYSGLCPECKFYF